MASLPTYIRSTGTALLRAPGSSWKWYRSRARWLQIVIAIVVLVLLIAAIAWARSGTAPAEPAEARAVTIESVGALVGNGGGASIIGTVRSVTQAELYAQAGGVVKGVYTHLGAAVPAGFVIADLDNASQAAAVLQAEGSYDSAVAARAGKSLPDTRASARETYQAAYTSIDTIVQNDIDQFFGDPTPTGPRLLINPGASVDLPRKRQALDDILRTWNQHLATAATADPGTLLTEATTDTQAVSSFLLELTAAANDRDSNATQSQIAALAQARSTVDATLSKLNTARTSLRSDSVSATASADATVKSALGALRAAQANYEKTRIRATIGGTVNFLPIQAGQYVNMNDHVATVAQNGSLEIVAYVPEDQRNALSVGMKVSVEGGHDGTVTVVAPALDPSTKQIEVHIAVDASPDLVNGQSVRITLPNDTSSSAGSIASSTPSSAPTLLPLTAVKLLADSRAVFTVDENGRIVAHAVTIGDVVGDRIEVLSGVTPDMRIVTDVRGLSEGQKVRIADAS